MIAIKSFHCQIITQMYKRNDLRSVRTNHRYSLIFSNAILQVGTFYIFLVLQLSYKPTLGVLVFKSSVLQTEITVQ